MIGNNSCGVHALMGGKTVDNIDELDVMLYDGMRMTRRRDERRGARRDHRAPAGARGEIYAGLKSDSRSVRAAHPREVSAHPAPRVRLQPRRAAARERLQRRARARRQRGHVRHGARSDAAPHREPAVPASGLHRVSRSRSSPPTTCPRSSPTSRSASKGSTTRFPIRFARRGCGSTSCKLLPEGKGVLLVEFGAWTSEDADAQAERFGAWLATLSPRPNYIVCTPQRGGGGVARARVGARRRRDSARQAAGWEGWEDAAVAARAPRLVPARDLRADAASTTTTARSTATSATAACTCASTSTCRPSRASRSSASSSIARRTSSSRTADRSPASTATARRAARCCRRCSAPS